ncbi:MAG: hypothetical protein JXA20_15470 [Spirochaetes bacterium]|nr:hypothetical protein [Spirochaetota bacterium]
MIWGIVLFLFKIKFIKKAKTATAEVTGYTAAPEYPLFLCYFLILSFRDDRSVKRVFRSNLALGFQRFAKERIGRKYTIYYINENTFRAELKNLLFVDPVFLTAFGILSGFLVFIVVT